MLHVLEVDEYTEAISALGMVAETGNKALTDTYYWKWIILSLHSALQGFMVLSLRSQHALLPLTNKSAKAWMKAYRANKPYPQERLDTFLNLFEKIKDNEALNNGIGRKFVPKGNQEKSVRAINRYRNKLIHFLPQTYFFDLRIFPDICLDCLAVIEFSGWLSGNIHWSNQKINRRGKSVFSKATQIFKQFKKDYDT